MLIVNWKEIKHNNKKYVQDDDCHWYVIHKDDYELFNELLEEYSNLENKYWSANDEDRKKMKSPNDILSEFEDKFSNWMTWGSMDLLDDEIDD